MEIIVSMVIISLTILGLANLVVAGRRHIRHSRMRMAGSEVGKYFVDPLSMDVRQDEWGSNCLTSGAGCPGAQTVGDMTFQPTYTMDTVDGIRRVRVSIQWNETVP